MVRPHLGPLKRFNTIGPKERQNVLDALRGRPLSGYIGGDPSGGYYIEKLKDEWAKTFCVEHAIPCNSATSGLLAACMAIGIGPGDEVWTTPYSMSATAACAKVLGAKLRFIDIEPDRFGINPKLLQGLMPPKAVIVANIFGHPAHLNKIMAWCRENNVKLIEDNAQSPMATENGDYAGTVGHIGVFSLNVHKHIQCGEGGVIVTRDAELAARLENVINHGELAFDHRITGLNLRMTEPIAAIACAQLLRAGSIIEGRRQIGLELCDMVKGVSWMKPHVDQPGCKHVYYVWTAQVAWPHRSALVNRLHQAGVPIRAGYAPLLNGLFKTRDPCPVALEVDDSIIVFEVCAYDLPRGRLDALREIVKRVTGELHEDRAA